MGNIVWVIFILSPRDIGKKRFGDFDLMVFHCTINQSRNQIVWSIFKFKFSGKLALVVNNMHS